MSPHGSGTNWRPPITATAFIPLLKGRSRTAVGFSPHLQQHLPSLSFLPFAPLLVEGRLGCHRPEAPPQVTPPWGWAKWEVTTGPPWHLFPAGRTGCVSPFLGVRCPLSPRTLGPVKVGLTDHMPLCSLLPGASL